jgi:hypothetical protein
MKVNEILNESSDGFAGFNEDQVNDLERYIGDLIDDLPEITAIETNPYGDGFRAHISFDGKNNKNNRGTVEFTCQQNGRNKGITDFKMTNLTGTNYNKTPHLP